MKRLSIAALAVLISCGSVETEARPPRPAMWKVADADTTVYLFGTIHLLPKGLEWASPKTESAIAASSGLVLETVIGDPQAVAGVMRRLGVSPGLPPLVERVAEDKRAALLALVAKSGIPIAVLDGFETWAAGITLASVALRELSVSTEYGAEAVLTKRFKAAGKPVSGLETPGEQLGYFDGLPEAAQRVFLTSIVADDGNAAEQFNGMLAAWSSGDVRRIAATFDEELKLSPEILDALLTRRNANWAKWVETRMAMPGTVFVAVGAGHLAGTNSVGSLLANKGLRVTRVQ